MFFSYLLEIASSLIYLALHVTSPGSFPPPLSKEREAALLEQSIKGDKNARNKLIEHNLRLVAHIVKKYYTETADQEDLISIGTIGLIKAVSTFKPQKSSRLSTYAARCIENEILMHFRNLKKCSHNVLISDPIDTDKDGNCLTLIDIIADDSDIGDEIDLKLRLEQLRDVIKKTLDNREKLIITMRYGLGGTKEYTQREIASKLKISRSYVSRIEKSALIKLKENLTK